MGNSKLGRNAIEEIRAAMRGARGTTAKSTAVRLARLHSVSWQRIYEITADLRPDRKKRSDRGKRGFEIVEGTDVWDAAQYVVADKLDPDQALLTCQVRGAKHLPSLGTFQKLLRENGLGRKSLRNPTRAFRSFEAADPGEMYQIDVTALKVRWQDEKTRRILRIDGVDKNHPQMDETKLRVWQIMLVDDCSRIRFLRYVATTHITSREMVRFECEAFTLLGVPHKLYTDNGSEFKGYHVRAEKILHSLLKDDGGYVHLKHAPGNSQASGKVENAHKWAEKMDRFVGLAVSEGQEVTIEDLNAFADRACEAYNNKRHRVTGETPLERWSSQRIVVRKLDPAVIESALLSDEFEVVLDAGMTVAHRGVAYKVPGVQPFVDFVGQKVKVVVPPHIDIILLTLPDGTEYELEKILAAADKAGEFRSTADSNAENLKKRLRETSREAKKAAKAKRKQTGEILPVPHYNVVIEQPATNVARFPHPERVITAAEVNKVVQIPFSSSPPSKGGVAAVSADGVVPLGGRGGVALPPDYSGRDIGYWEAVALFTPSFEGVDQAKQFMLGLFPNMAGTVAESQIEDAVKTRSAVRPPLRKVS
ncbi:MAG: transposase family protein [Acidobacteria bacterium]|nr:transposase family protein [Acidobacteriota bacterium]